MKQLQKSSLALVKGRARCLASSVHSRPCALATVWSRGAGGQRGLRLLGRTSVPHLSPLSQLPGEVSNNPIMFIQVRVTYWKTNPLRVTSSVASSTRPVCSPHLYRAAAHSLQPRRELVCIKQLLSIPFPRSPWKPPVYFPSLDLPVRDAPCTQIFRPGFGHGTCVQGSPTL